MRVHSQRSTIRGVLGLAVGLILLCMPGACAGPGLEPPNSDVGSSAGAGGLFDGGGEPTAGGAANAGSGGSSGAPVSEAGAGGQDHGDGDGDADAGEAAMDASVDDDGGSDPSELEP